MKLGIRQTFKKAWMFSMNLWEQMWIMKFLLARFVAKISYFKSTSFEYFVIHTLYDLEHYRVAQTIVASWDKKALQLSVRRRLTW